MIVVTCRAYFLPARRRPEGPRFYARRGPYDRRADNLDAEAQLSVESEVGEGEDNYNLQPSAVELDLAEGGGVVQAEDHANSGSQYSGDTPGDTMYGDPYAQEAPTASSEVILDQTDQANTEIQASNISQNSAEKQPNKITQSNSELHEGTKKKPKAQGDLSGKEINGDTYKKDTMTSPGTVAPWLNTPKGVPFVNPYAQPNGYYVDSQGRVVKNPFELQYQNLPPYPPYNKFPPAAPKNFNYNPNAWPDQFQYPNTPNMVPNTPYYGKKTAPVAYVNPYYNPNAGTGVPAVPSGAANIYQNTLPPARPRSPYNLANYNSGLYEKEMKKTNGQDAIISDVGPSTNTLGNELTQYQEPGEKVHKNSDQSSKTVQTDIVGQLNDGSKYSGEIKSNTENALEADKVLTRTRFSGQLPGTETRLATNKFSKLNYARQSKDDPSPGVDKYKLEEYRVGTPYVYSSLHKFLSQLKEEESEENLTARPYTEDDNKPPVAAIETRFKYNYPHRDYGYEHRSPRWHHG